MKDQIKKLIESIIKCPEPIEGMGNGLDALVELGIYVQCNHDKKKHEEQIKKLLEQIDLL